MSQYRRGLFWQNPYLRPDIPVSTGLITAKSLSVPRCTKVEGIIDLILSHIPASVKVGGYNRPDFVSHTRFRKFCWVQIACFCLPYPRQHKYIKILTGRCLRCPSVFLSVNIYFINGLLQPVCLHVLELLQHFLGRSLSRQADCDDSDKSQSEAYYQGI